MMKRPLCDTLDGSRFASMKELHFNAENGVWRVAYAFDPTRRAILLVAGIRRVYHKGIFIVLLSEKPTKGLQSICKS